MILSVQQSEIKLSAAADTVQKQNPFPPGRMRWLYISLHFSLTPPRGQERQVLRGKNDMSRMRTATAACRNGGRDTMPIDHRRTAPHSVVPSLSEAAGGARARVLTGRGSTFLGLFGAERFPVWGIASVGWHVQIMLISSTGHPKTSIRYCMLIQYFLGFHLLEY